jgi:hypothetical protein
MIFLCEGKLMNKLIAVSIASMFAFGSVAAMAQGGAGSKGMGGPDETPPQPVNYQELKMQRQMARDNYAKMSPEEKAAYKKGIAAQRQMDAMDAQAKAQNLTPTTPAEQKALNAQKGAPKAITSPTQRQDALKDAEKAPGAGGGGN